MGFYHLLLSIFLLSSLCSDAAVYNTCKPTEREALLQFKRSNIVDSGGTFSSWVGSDCCRDWAGVSCDNRTGHVIELQVFPEEAAGGLVPPQIGNLTHLEDLALIGFRIEGGWVARLTSLKHLLLWGTDLQRAPDLIDNLNMLPFISDVYITGRSVPIPVSLQHVNFTRLSSLTLQGNSLNMPVPSWLFNVTSLRLFDMSGSNLSGSIPPAIENLRNLESLALDNNELSGSIPEMVGGLLHLSILSLGRNELTGSIPSSLGNLTSLTRLDLSHNGLNGSMPEFIADLTSMEMLHLHDNNLQGVVTNSYFNNISRLSTLDLSSNPLEVRFDLYWIPPFQLEGLGLAHCRVGPSFPRWIQTQSGLVYLNLSNSGISGILPTLLWDFSRINSMDLSSNNLSGTIPSKLLDMPLLQYLSLANNHIEGPLPQLKNANDSRLLMLLSNNSFSGRIPISYCELKRLYVLDLSANHLSGRTPRCLQKLENLSILNFASNNLDESIEGMFSSFCMLKLLALNDNNFSGEFPSSLRRCSGLRVLTIGQNNFSGNLPAWIATNGSNLSVLIVSSNKLYGEIPQELQLLSRLQILDLSDNNFSGSIPHALGNFSAMKDPSTISQRFHDTGLLFPIKIGVYTITYSAFMVIKGQRKECSQLLALMVLIDLSSNELTGEIPRELSDLLGLKSLNLSRNHLVGDIPDNIGALKNVESMDFSFSNLHGEIPQSMLGINFLSTLNLSYNNLRGRIPSGFQFSTFDRSSYIGNAGLCGPPLPKSCDGQSPDEVHENMHEYQNGVVFLYLSMAFGFVFGFWAFYGILWFKRTWCYAYFSVIDNMLHKIYDEATKRSCSHSQGKNIG